MLCDTPSQPTPRISQPIIHVLGNDLFNTALQVEVQIWMTSTLQLRICRSTGVLAKLLLLEGTPQHRCSVCVGISGRRQLAPLYGPPIFSNRRTLISNRGQGSKKGSDPGPPFEPWESDPFFEPWGPSSPSPRPFFRTVRPLFRTVAPIMRRETLFSNRATIISNRGANPRPVADSGS